MKVNSLKSAHKKKTNDKDFKLEISENVSELSDKKPNKKQISTTKNKKGSDKNSVMKSKDIKLRGKQELISKVDENKEDVPEKTEKNNISDESNEAKSLIEKSVLTKNLDTTTTSFSNKEVEQTSVTKNLNDTESNELSKITENEDENDVEIVTKRTTRASARKETTVTKSIGKTTAKVSDSKINEKSLESKLKNEKVEEKMKKVSKTNMDQSKMEGNGNISGYKTRTNKASTEQKGKSNELSHSNVSSNSNKGEKSVKSGPKSFKIDKEISTSGEDILNSEEKQQEKSMASNKKSKTVGKAHSIEENEVKTDENISDKNIKQTSKSNEIQEKTATRQSSRLLASRNESYQSTENKIVTKVNKQDINSNKTSKNKVQNTKTQGNEVKLAESEKDKNGTKSANTKKVNKGNAKNKANEKNESETGLPKRSTRSTEKLAHDTITKEKNETDDDIKAKEPDADPLDCVTRGYSSESDHGSFGFVGGNNFKSNASSDDEKHKESLKDQQIVPPFVELEPIVRPRLTVVDISKLQKKFDEPKQEESKRVTRSKINAPSNSSICIINDESNDIIDLTETDPLACTEEELQIFKSNNVPTISAFKIDTEENENENILAAVEPIRRSLRGRAIEIVPMENMSRKRAREPEPEPMKEATDPKKRKTRSKRLPDVNLRRNVEERKNQEAISSDDEDEKKEDSGKNKRPTPKKKTEPLKSAEKTMKSVKDNRVKTVKEEIIRVDSPSSDLASENSRTDTTATPTSIKPKSVKNTSIKKRNLMDIDTSLIIPGESEDGRNVRQSRRIAQQKIKEQVECKKFDDITIIDIKHGEKKKKHKKEEKEEKSEKKKKKDKKVSDEEYSVEEVITSDKKRHKKKRKKQNRAFNALHPWRSSSDSDSSDEEEEEEELEIEEEVSEYERVPELKSDHEFSPESDIENASEIQPMRRARTVKKESDAEEPTDVHACQKCGKSDHPEWILLCDTCDCGWHCSCLRPALFVIPEGDWFCPPCQHLSLIKALKNQLIEFDRHASKLEMEARRKERLAYVGIGLDNVIPSKDSHDQHRSSAKTYMSEYDSGDSESSSGSSSEDDSDEPIYRLRERRQAHSYRFNDYDDLINSAIQDEMEIKKFGASISRGKDISTIINAEKEEKKELEIPPEPEIPPVVPVNKEIEYGPKLKDDMSDQSNDEFEKEKPRGFNRGLVGRRKHRKLNCLDVSSNDDADSDEDFKGDSASEDEDVEEDFGSYDSDDSGGRRRDREPVRRSTRARVTRYDKEFINDDSDDDYGPRKKKSRSMWEQSESEDSDKSWGRRGKYKKRQFSSTSTKYNKRSKKKKKVRRIDDSDLESKPKVKRPRIKFGGLDDSDEEILPRRTRGKKTTYVDTLGSDSEEERFKPKARIIESEEEYVANEDEEEDEVVHDEPIEKEDSEAESAEDKPPVVPKKIINVPALAKVPKSPRARGRGRGKGGIQRQRKSPSPVLPTFESQHPSLQQPTTFADKIPFEEKSPLPDIPIIAANPEDLDEEEVGMMMEEEEYATRQLELMAIQLAKEKRKRELEAQAQKLLAQKLEAEKIEAEAVELKKLEAQKMEPYRMEQGIEHQTMEPQRIEQQIIVPQTMEPQRIELQKTEPSVPEYQKIDFQKAHIEEVEPQKIEPEKVEPIKIVLHTPEMERIQKLGMVTIKKVEIPTPVETLQEGDKSEEPKKRGRRKKYVEGASPLKQQLQQAKIVPPIIINKALITPPPPVLNTNIPEPENSLVMSENESLPTVVQDLSITPTKRRGRGKGKKTLAAEQAAAAVASVSGLPSSELSLTNSSTAVSECSTVNSDSQSNPVNSTESDFHNGKLGIATPPQPFSQNQPTPSVITRMLQSQPITTQAFTTAASAINQKFFGGVNLEQSRAPSQFQGITPRGRVPSPYRQNMPSNPYTSVRPTLVATASHRLRSPGPSNMQQMFHSPHHPLDPSPSGGGHITTNTGDRQSPSEVTTKDNPTPPPPPQYNQGSIPGPGEQNRFPNPSDSHPGPSTSPVRPHHIPFPTSGSHVQPASPPRPPTGGGSFSPYHPPPPPNYHYGAYPPPPSLTAAEDALPPTVYQSSPYPEHYNQEVSGTVAQTSEESDSKPFEEEGSGEFGGLVSYFSSQREDDLDA